MPFTPAPAVAPPKPAGTGISCSLRISKRGSNTFWLIFNQEAQQRLFGGSIVGRHVSVGIGRGSDEGKLLVAFVEDGGFEVSRSFRGAALIKVGAWDLLPKDKRPVGPGEVVTVSAEAIVIKLPKWARPSAPDGKLGSEFGLKPVPRAPQKAASLAEAGEIMQQAVRK